MTAPSSSGGALLDEAGLQALARRLAPHVAPPLCCFLHGELGAGKTTFVRALIQALGHQGRVKSPTYGLLEEYRLEGLKVLHLDLYRIADSSELEFLGIADLYDQKTLLLVEWPQHGARFLPPADLGIFFEHAGDKRLVNCQAYNSSGKALCDYFDKLL